MPIRPLLEAIQASSLPTSIRESTWGFPILGALHVLTLAWFGIAVLFRTRALRQWGLAAMGATGTALFLLQPLRYLSTAMAAKVVFLIAAISIKDRRVCALAWLAVLFASRWLAY